MASEPDASVRSVSTLIDQFLAMPLLAAVATARSEPENPDRESTNRQSIDRIILINPLTQQMTVIGGIGIPDLNSVLNGLMSKEGQPPASQAAIDGMPEVEVKHTEEIENLGGECVICLEEWRIGDVAKEMPCKHRFHGGCVERWLKIHGSCPLCRCKMPVVKKIGDESGRRRGREIWVMFEIGNGRFSGDDESVNEESSMESREL